MEQKDLGEYTLKEFQEMENFGRDAVFDSVIIVPTNELHDSGFRCMKFILCNHGVIVGCVGGMSDVVMPNGIGNLGWWKPNDFSHRLYAGMVPYLGLSMDCLPGSNCIRLMMSMECVREPGDYILSDFCFYSKKEIDDAKND